jgi:ribosomal protein S18 acetylase RimI-like enzyme
VTSIGLHVFAGNKSAIALYEHSGFEVTSFNMKKQL